MDLIEIIDEYYFVIYVHVGLRVSGSINEVFALYNYRHALYSKPVGCKACRCLIFVVSSCKRKCAKKSVI